MLIGHIKALIRHPVKSFQGEHVPKTNVMSYGLYGDRSHAFLDETRSGKYLTITQFPEMAAYRARFVGEESVEAYPDVEVTTPEGRVMKWGDKDLIREIENKSKRNVTPVQYSPSHVPPGAIELENILLVTDASLIQLQEMWGKAIDHRRFRPNIVLSLKEKTPFIEETWLGKRLQIGKNVEIQLNSHCERCMIITVHPDHAERDPSLLKMIVNEREQIFGVYASVIKTGEIEVEDEVVLLD
ncbi:MAG: MOSC domain-containing protein [Bacillaceae bacterium]|nr:MOSC domain-containing protein [Bacillaceae bacterium]